MIMEAELQTVDDIKDILNIGVDDYQETHLRYGIPKYKYRTRAEKIKYCGRVMGTARDGNFGGIKPIREWRCGIVHPDEVNGDLTVCSNCVNLAKQKRYAKALDRIDFAVDRGDTIFCVVTNGKNELRDVQRDSKRLGYEYMAIPTEVKEQRYVFANGPVRGAEITPYSEIKMQLSYLNRKLNDGYVSGKLGLEAVDEQDTDFSLALSYGVYDIDGKKEAEFDAIAIVLTSDIDITRDTFQGIYDLRQKIFIELVKTIDSQAVLIDSGVSPINFDFAKESFVRVRVKESGRIDLLDPDTKNALYQMKQSVLNKIEEYKVND